MKGHFLLLVRVDLKTFLRGSIWLFLVTRVSMMKFKAFQYIATLIHLPSNHGHTPCRPSSFTSSPLQPALTLRFPDSFRKVRWWSSLFDSRQSFLLFAEDKAFVQQDRRCHEERCRDNQRANPASETVSNGGTKQFDTSSRGMSLPPTIWIQSTRHWA